MLNITMNEAEIRAELIDPALKAAGWGVTEGSKVHREYLISVGKIQTGVNELDQEKLPFLLTNKYQSLEDAKEMLGDPANISRLFIEFQKHLYLKKIA